MRPPMSIVTWFSLGIIYWLLRKRNDEINHVPLFAATKDCLHEENLKNSAMPVCHSGNCNLIMQFENMLIEVTDENILTKSLVYMCYCPSQSFLIHSINSIPKIFPCNKIMRAHGGPRFIVVVQRTFAECAHTLESLRAGLACNGHPSLLWPRSVVLNVCRVCTHFDWRSRLRAGLTTAWLVLTLGFCDATLSPSWCVHSSVLAVC